MECMNVDVAEQVAEWAIVSPLADGFHLLVGKFFVSSSRDGMPGEKKVSCT